MIASVCDGRSLSRCRIGGYTGVGSANWRFRLQPSSEAYGGSPLHARHDVQGPTDRARPLLHADDADTVAVPTDGLEVEPASVVADGHLDVVSRAREHDCQSMCRTMDDPVSEGLLSNSKETDGNIRGKLPKSPSAVKVTCTWCRIAISAQCVLSAGARPSTRNVAGCRSCESRRMASNICRVSLASSAKDRCARAP